MRCHVGRPSGRQRHFSEHSVGLKADLQSRFTAPAGRGLTVARRATASQIIRPQPNGGLTGGEAPGLTTVGKKRTPSSKRWLAEHEADIYVHEARRLGYRSRAIFKLKEIQERDRILKQGMTVVDLGAAPGGWSQYARPLLGPSGRLVALDILPMEPIPQVEFICGDFREDAVLQQLEGLAGEGQVDLVLSDMAPNITGIDIADQAAGVYLAELALDFAGKRLKRGGNMLVKLFMGDGFEQYVKKLREHFGAVQVRKPKASRPRSSEVYLLARNHGVL
jgi:23S rRNA (uridine2552-2'-O)-methyltransferase